MLAAGRVPLPTAGEPVTRLQLQREFAPADDFPVHADWAALDGSDAVLGNLAMVLRGLREAVAQVRADEMGRRAWEQVRVTPRAGRAVEDLRQERGAVLQRRGHRLQ